jgi:hypothetical protein
MPPLGGDASVGTTGGSLAHLAGCRPGVAGESPDWGDGGAAPQSPEWGRRRSSARRTLLSLIVWIVERAKQGGNSGNGNRTDTELGLDNTCIG